MDYHAIHGYDRASFDMPGTHRLPTVSASQILDDLQDYSSSLVSTGLDDLDQALLGIGSIDAPDSSAQRGGVKRGQVTEIWGPPGTGKTALGLQLTANALCDGDAVVWIGLLFDKFPSNFSATSNLDMTHKDCFQVIRSHRVKAVVEAVGKTRAGTELNANPQGSNSSRFFHYSCLTLAHFIALISRPTSKSIPENCSLVVISSLSALLNSAVPKSNDAKGNSNPSKGPTPLVKRVQALQSIMNALRKLAATRNCAVVILSQCATKMHSERGATLISAVNATVWEQGISTRLILFRDWSWQGNKLASVFLAGLQKVDGKATQEAVEGIVAFKVEQEGVATVPYDGSQSIEIEAGQKRKRGRTELEVPDSEDDEDYGWADEDEAAMPPPPPQWQGSEDILLGQDVGRSEADYSDDGRSENDGFYDSD